MDLMLDVKIPAFMRTFNCSRDICDNAEIRSWIENCAADLVDYDGYLLGEDKSHYDRRREMAMVYEGDIAPLAQYIRELHPEYNHMLDEDVVFLICNDVNDIKHKIRELEDAMEVAQPEPEVESHFSNPQPDEESLEVEEKIVEPVVKHKVETPVSVVQEEPKYAEANTYEEDSDLDSFFAGDTLDSEVEESTRGDVQTDETNESTLKSAPQEVEEQTPTVQEVKESPKAEESPKVEEKKEPVSLDDDMFPIREEVKSVHEDVEVKSVKTEEKKDVEKTSNIGALNLTPQENNIKLSEETKMAQGNTTNTMAGLNSMKNLAGQSMNRGPAKPVNANNQAAIESVIELLKSQAVERTNYVKNNFITEMIIAAKPNMLRMREGATGVIATDEAAARTRLRKLQESFKEATGYSDAKTAEAEAALQDFAVKFPRLAEMNYSKEEWNKVEAIRRVLFDELPLEPLKEFAVFRPAKPAYNVKGVRINRSEIYNLRSLAALIAAKASGGLYCEGSFDGVAPIENATYFEGIVATKTSKPGTKDKKGAKPQSATIKTSGTNKDDKKYAAYCRIYNKNAFIENNPNGIITLFETLDDVAENYKQVTAKACVEVTTQYGDQTQTVSVPASFRYPVEVKETEAGKGNTVNKKDAFKTFKISVKTEVLATTAEPCAAVPKEVFDQEFKSAKGVTKSVNKTANIPNFADAAAFESMLPGKTSTTGVHTDNRLAHLVRMIAQPNGLTDDLREIPGIGEDIKAMIAQVKGETVAKQEEVKTAADTTKPTADEAANSGI